MRREPEQEPAVHEAVLVDAHPRIATQLDLGVIFIDDARRAAQRRVDLLVRTNIHGLGLQYPPPEGTMLVRVVRLAVLLALFMSGCGYNAVVAQDEAVK